MTIQGEGKPMTNGETMRDIEFKCHVCGTSTDIAPMPPAKAVCEQHCEDHNYVYMRDLFGHFCENCGKKAPDDWFDD